MSNLFNEIDEDLRQEKLKGIWSKYRNSIFSSIIIVALILISSESYKYLTNSKIEKSGVIFSQIIENILQDNTEDAAININNLLNDGTKEYRNYAMIMKADLLISENNLISAEALYNEIIDSTKGLLRDLAKLKLAYIKVDDSSYAEIELMLSQLLVEDNILYLFAKEVLALSAYKEGLYDQGINHAEEIMKNERTTTGMFDRANMMLKVFNSKI
ncbi:MAG: tetratricopeptide repeat protein [Hyphomicrobiales bacterium]|jgi:hypothetical protein|nr:tetratricopeptide repeat protein [Hyphomicrobiales bacterium]|tara:strand:- start:39 stop:683 length:645 start_codon:yes stop_codon:yes gene_type:complete